MPAFFAYCSHSVLPIEEGRRQRAEGRRFNLEGDSNPS